MKKLIKFTFVLILALTLIACAGNSSQEPVYDLDYNEANDMQGFGWAYQYLRELSSGLISEDDDWQRAMMERAMDRPMSDSEWEGLIREGIIVDQGNFILDVSVSDEQRALIYEDGRLYRKRIEGLIEQDPIFVEWQIRQNEMYLGAIAQGFTVTDEEVYAVLEEHLQLSRGAVNQNQFLIFLEGAQMTEYEYWASQFGNMRVNLIIGHYLESLPLDERNQRLNWLRMDYN